MTCADNAGASIRPRGFPLIPALPLREIQLGTIPIPLEYPVFPDSFSG